MIGLTWYVIDFTYLDELTNRLLTVSTLTEYR